MNKFIFLFCNFIWIISGNDIVIISQGFQTTQNQIDKQYISPEALINGVNNNFPPNFTLIREFIIETSLPQSGMQMSIGEIININQLTNLFSATFQQNVINNVGQIQFSSLPNFDLEVEYSLENGLFRLPMFLALDISNIKTHLASGIVIDVKFNIFYLEKTFVNYPNSYKQIEMLTLSDVKLDDLALSYVAYNSMDGTIYTKFDRLYLYKNEYSFDIISEGFFTPALELYHLIFYQEPSKSQIFYNWSEFNLGPSESGKTNNVSNSINSFFISSPKKQTYWITYNSTIPSYIEIPLAVCKHFTRKEMTAFLVFDIIMMSTDFKYVNSKIEYEQKIMSFKDIDGSYEISVYHEFDLGYFTMYEGSRHKFSIKKNDTLLQTQTLNEISFYNLNDVKIFMVLHHLPNQNLYLEVQINQDKYYVDITLGTNVSLSPSKSFQFYVGNNEPKASSTVLFAISYKRFVLFDGYGFMYRNDNEYMYSLGKYDKRLIHVNNKNIWIPSSKDKIAYASYQEKLKNSDTGYVEYMSWECPNNCEYCVLATTCIVCQSGYFLDIGSQCTLKESRVEQVYFDQAREYITEIDPYNFPLTGNPISEGPESFFVSNFAIFSFELDKNSFDQNANPPEFCNYYMSSPNSKVFEFINWKFRPYSEDYSFFVDIDENYFKQALYSIGGIVEPIGSDGCPASTNGNQLAYFNLNCGGDNLITPSLKGLIYLIHCNSVQFELTGNPHMLSKFTSISNENYGMIKFGNIEYYFKCSNNCVCKDTSTNLKINSCYMNPDIGSICGPTETLSYFSLNDYLVECIDKNFLYNSCWDGCSDCDFITLKCTSCINSAHDLNLFELNSSYKYCGDCVGDCLACSGPTLQECHCMKTSEYTVFNPATFSCYEECPSSCKTCEPNTSKCLACNDPLYDINIIEKGTLYKYCGACATDCLSCSGPTVSDCHCMKASELTIFDQNTFYCGEPCPQTCNECIAGTTQCKSCKDPIYDINVISKGSSVKYCGECIRNCLSCSGPTIEKCHCMKDYKPITFNPLTFECIEEIEINPVSKCISHCEICSNELSCEKCNTNYMYIEERSQCVHFNEILSSCSKYMIHNQEIQCLLCSEQYFLNDKNICQKCSSNCLHCSNEQTCLVCKDKFLLDENTFQCMTSQLFLNFRIPINKNFPYLIFIEKINGFILYKNYQEILNKKEIVDEITLLSVMYSHIFIDCSKEFKLHHICLNSDNDLHSIHFFENNCLIPNCLICNNSFKCSLCKSSYKWNSKNLLCEKITNQITLPNQSNIIDKDNKFNCPQNYFFNKKINKCFPYIENCLKMKQNRCTLCKPVYHLNENKTSCIQCSDNCERCANQNFCEKCKLSYFLFNQENSKNVICKKCPDLCKSCLSDSFCLECINDNYSIQKISQTNHICTRNCIKGVEFQYNHFCKNCSQCKFCWVKEVPQCLTCPQCNQNCEITIEEIKNKNHQIYEIKSSSIIFDTVAIENKLQKTYSKSLFSIQNNLDGNFLFIFNNDIIDKFNLNELEIEILISKKETIARNCLIHPNNEMKILLNYANDNEKYLFSFYVFNNMINAVQSASIFIIPKTELVYLIIDLINRNKLINYLFISFISTNGVIAQYNIYSRSLNYKYINPAIFMFFNLKSNSDKKEFELLKIDSGFKLNEDQFAEIQYIDIVSCLMFGCIALLRVILSFKIVTKRRMSYLNEINQDPDILKR